MNLGIKGRVAMVAAASKGIGRACAEALAAEGCRVAICARNPDTLAETAAALTERGAEVLATPVDVSSASDLDRWVSAVQTSFGACDILITNTGGPPAARFLDLTDAQWQSGVDATLLNVVRLCRARWRR